MRYTLLLDISKSTKENGSVDEPILLRRALRRFHAHTHQRRRFLERGGAKYFGTDEKFIAYLKEQPKRCSCRCCGNPRRFRYYTMYEYELDGMGQRKLVMKRRSYISEKERLTLHERKADLNFREQIEEMYN